MIRSHTPLNSKLSLRQFHFYTTRQKIGEKDVKTNETDERVTMFSNISKVLKESEKEKMESFYADLKYRADRTCSLLFA